MLTAARRHRAKPTIVMTFPSYLKHSWSEVPNKAVWDGNRLGSSRKKGRVNVFQIGRAVAVRRGYARIGDRKPGWTIPAEAMVSAQVSGLRKSKQTSAAKVSRFRVVVGLRLRVDLWESR